MPFSYIITPKAGEKFHRIALVSVTILNFLDAATSAEVAANTANSMKTLTLN